MSINETDLADRFAFHPAETHGKRANHEHVRAMCWELAVQLNQLLPANAGRELALVITNLEQVMFWANAGLARYPEES